MKKRITIVGLLITWALYVFMACSSQKTEQIVTSLDHVNVHMAPSTNNKGDISFFLLSENEKPSVSVLALNGANVKNVKVLEVLDDTEWLSGRKYQGKFMSWHSVVYSIPDDITDDVIIESITLNIDGKERNYAFHHPIYEERETETKKNGTEISLVGGAFAILGASIPDNQIYDQTYRCSEKIEVLEIAFNDFLYMDDVKIYTKNASSGEQKEVTLPIELEPEDTLTIEFSVHYRPETGCSIYDQTYCSMVVKYRKESDSSLSMYSSSFGVQGVGNEEEADKLADILLKEKKEK